MDGLRKVPDNVPNAADADRQSRQAADANPRPVRRPTTSFAHHNNAMLRTFPRPLRLRLRVRLSATDCYTTRPLRRDRSARCSTRWDAIMGVMLPTLREDRRKTYSPVLPISPSSGPRAPGAGRGDRRRGRADRVRRRGRQPRPAIGVRRPGQAAVEGRLGGALGRARGRLRDVGQGPDRQRHPVGQDRAHPRRPPARGLQLRDVPRRKGREDLQVEGQRPQPRGVAALRQRGEPRLLHLPRAAQGEEPAHRGHPARGRRILAVPRQLSGPAARAEARQPGAPHPWRQGAGDARCR